ncbi:ATP synthase subunit beta chloroplastic [Bienertia sinuspersici]
MLQPRIVGEEHYKISAKS